LVFGLIAWSVWRSDVGAAARRQRSLESVGRLALKQAVQGLLSNETELARMVGAMPSGVARNWPVFSRSVLADPATNGVGLIVPVTERDRPAFERTHRLRIVETTAQAQVVPAPPRQRYWVVVASAERQGATPSVLGLDVGISAARREAMSRAAVTGRPVATPPMRYLTGPARYGVVVYVAVKAPDGQVRGWVSAAYRASLLTAAVRAHLLGAQVSIRDGSTALIPDPAARAGRPVSLLVAGRHWTLRVFVPAAAVSLVPLLVLLLGVLLSCFVVVALRRLDAVSRERKQGLAAAQRLAQLGSWSWDPRDDVAVWSAEMFRIFSRDPRLGAPSRAEFLGYVAAEDQGKTRAWHAAMLAGDDRAEFEFRITNGDDVERMLHAVASRDRRRRGRYVGTVQDVTGPRAIEAELARGKARLQAIIDHAPAAIVVRDLDGRYEHVSRAVVDSLGRSSDEIVGLTAAEFCDPDTVAEIERQDAQMIAAGTSMVEEVEAIHGDGTRHVYHTVRYPIVDESGAVSGLGSFALDVTDRKQVEKNLREREQQLADAQALAHLGTWELDLATERLSWSDELCQIGGQPAGYSPTLSEFMELVHPDDRADVEARVEQSRHLEFSDNEYRLIRPGGEIRHVHTRRFGRFDERGVMTKLWGTTQDITERTIAEVALREARQYAEAIITAMGEGYALTVGGTLVAVNDSLCTLTGFTREQLVGAGMPFPFWPTDELGVAWGIRDRVVGAGGGTFEMRVMRADGSRFDAEITAHPAHNADGTLLGFVNTMRDVSERKRYEAELERERRDLNEAQVVARVGSWDYDPRADPPRRWSPQFWQMLGLEPQAAAPPMDEFYAMVAPADRDRVRDALRKAVEDGAESWDGEFGMNAADGRELIVSMHAEYPRDAHGQRTGSHGTLQDITDRAQRDAEERGLRRIAELVAANAGSAAVFEAVASEVQKLLGAHSGLVERFDEAGGFCTVISGHQRDGKPIGEIAFTHDGHSASATVVRTAEPARVDTPHPSGTDTGAAWLVRNQIVGAVAAPVIVGGKLWGTLSANFTEASIPADAEQRLGRFARLTAMAIGNAESWDLLSRQASTDAVTGLANHRTFQERLRSEVTRARRYERHLSLVLLDIDHFKDINDAHGHQAGDKVLAELGRRLATQAREGETIARIGGEEFAWLMPETERDSAYQAAERVRRAIESEPFPRVGRVTVSAGVCASDSELDGEELVRLADRALYWAKDGGRNTTFIYTDDAHALLSANHRAEASQTMASIRALARAIDCKDADTREHSERVAELAQRLALQLGWTTKRARLLHDCGLLHDVGKIGISDEILLKPAKLTEAEYEEIKRHAALSARIASEVLEDEQVRWIRGHHERWDGTGYPDQLLADRIPDGAQILAVADAYDVMTASRVYQRQRTPAEALTECQTLAGKQFSPVVVEALGRVTVAVTATP
jgi:diguanylate cyclase (GGDEF)-like protein/PAS domain S-box-containing protein/putative nucleotidyltransferase with HDIG domain